MSIVLRFCISFIMTVCYKMRQMLLQNATAILLQNATGVYYKNASGSLLQNATVIIKYDVYYKLWQSKLNKAVKKNVHQSFLTSILVSRYLFVYSCLIASSKFIANGRNSQDSYFCSNIHNIQHHIIFIYNFLPARVN